MSRNDSLDRNVELTAPFGKMWRSNLLVLLFALIVRSAVLLAMGGSLANDPDSYRKIAENLLREGTFGLTHGSEVYPTAYRPPLYPLFLAKIGSDAYVPAWRVGALHLVSGLATVWLVLILGRRWELGVYTNIAALLVACDPILLYQSAQVMTETLATFFAVVCLFCLTRFHSTRDYWTAGLAGGSLALAVLCRPTFLPWLILFVAIVPLLRTSWPRRIANTFAAIAIAATILAPWGVRNYQVFGRPILTTTHGGYTLLLGNNPEFYRHLRESPWGTVWNAPADLLDELSFIDVESNVGSSIRIVGGPPVHQNDSDDTMWNQPLSIRIGGGLRVVGDELTDDEHAYYFARQSIRDEPGMFAYACFDRIVQLWNLLPHQTGASESLLRRALRYAVAVWYLAVFFTAAIGANSLRRQLVRSPWLWGVLLCFVFTGIHTFYWTNLRMRAPLMPFVCLLAAVGVRALVQRWRTKRNVAVAASNPQGSQPFAGG